MLLLDCLGSMTWPEAVVWTALIICCTIAIIAFFWAVTRN